MLSYYGYCSKEVPKQFSRLCRNRKKRRYFYRINTYSYLTLCHIYYEFHNTESLLRIPLNIGEYLTPIGFAFLLQDDGIHFSIGVKLNLYRFFYEDVLLLQYEFYNKFFLFSKVVPIKQNKTKFDRYFLFFIRDLDYMFELVQPYMVKSMQKNIFLK